MGTPLISTALVAYLNLTATKAGISRKLVDPLNTAVSNASLESTTIERENVNLLKLRSFLITAVGELTSIWIDSLLLAQL